MFPPSSLKGAIAAHHQARQKQLGDNMAPLLVELEEAVSINRTRREAAREADGTAREAKRKLGVLTAQRCVPQEPCFLSVVSRLGPLYERAGNMAEGVQGYISYFKNNELAIRFTTTL